MACEDDVGVRSWLVIDRLARMHGFRPYAGEGESARWRKFGPALRSGRVAATARMTEAPTPVTGSGDCHLTLAVIAGSAVAATMTSRRPCPVRS